jgi:PST family polysaccharide transporter
MFLNALCSVIGFLLAVKLGIVAVAASFVIVGYLLAPFSYIAVQRLIQIDFRTYLMAVYAATICFSNDGRCHNGIEIYI